MPVLAGLVEKSRQIDLIATVLVLAEANGKNERFVVVRRVEVGAVYAAKIDEIEGGSSHHEHRFKLIRIGEVGEIDDATAVLIHRKLANSAQFSVHRCAVGEKLGAVFDSTARAKRLLLFLALNG